MSSSSVCLIAVQGFAKKNYGNLLKILTDANPDWYVTPTP
jgi:hypothetical protein